MLATLPKPVQELVALAQATDTSLQEVPVKEAPTLDCATAMTRATDLANVLTSIYQLQLFAAKPLMPAILPKLALAAVALAHLISTFQIQPIASHAWL